MSPKACGKCGRHSCLMFFAHPKCYVKLNRSFRCDNGPLDTLTGKLGEKCKMQNQCQTFVSEAICCFKNVSNFRKKTHGFHFSTHIVVYKSSAFSLRYRPPAPEIVRTENVG